MCRASLRETVRETLRQGHLLELKFDMVRKLILGVALASILATAQEGVDQGSIVDGSYSNPFFGLTLTPPLGVRLSSKPIVKSTDSHRTTFQLANGWADPELGRVRKGIVLYADNQDPLPAKSRGAEKYLARVARHQLQDGYEVLDQNLISVLADRSFLRADFKKGVVSEAILVTEAKGFIIVMIFTGGSVDEINNLIRNTKLQISAQ